MKASNIIASGAANEEPSLDGMTKGSVTEYGFRGFSSGKVWNCFMQIDAFWAISAYESDGFEKILCTRVIKQLSM